MGVTEHGEPFMRKRFELSAVRLLLNIFRTGLFENPYLNIQNSIKTVGNPEFMKAGYNAQLKSVVMLKNAGNILPLKKGSTIYLPKKYTAPFQGFFGPPSKEKYEDAVNPTLLNKYFNLTDDPSKADCAIVFINSPSGGSGYDATDVNNGGNGYVPITLQYGPYTASEARVHSLASGDPSEPNVLDRTYKGKSIITGNFQDLKTIQETKLSMNGKPVIIVLTANKPYVPAEFEKDVNAILLSFGVQNQVILDILSGIAEPSGLLPVQLPADMNTVEQQNEDIPHDMVCYIDASKNVYDFGFGMNWKGVIHDARTKKYVKTVADPVITVNGNSVTISNAGKAKIYYSTNGLTPAFIGENQYFK
ncbi:MAG: glycoside hydrolase family 3 C-terminal domain-containing protein, partial [Candidatus Paceibacterales bacterium]